MCTCVLACKYMYVCVFVYIYAYTITHWVLHFNLMGVSSCRVKSVRIRRERADSMKLSLLLSRWIQGAT